MNIEHWMNWEGGVDVAGFTRAGMDAPNIIIHVARMVQTPVGIAASGMVLIVPEEGSGIEPFMGFVSEDEEVGSYFGPNIFADSPFMMARHYEAMIEVFRTDRGMGARVEVGERSFEVTLSGLAAPQLLVRPIGHPWPFAQHVLEREATECIVKIDGVHVPLFFDPAGSTSGLRPVFSPAGIYAR